MLRVCVEHRNNWVENYWNSEKYFLFAQVFMCSLLELQRSKTYEKKLFSYNIEYTNEYIVI